MASGNVIAPYLARLTAVPADYIDQAAATFTRIAERHGGTMMGRYKLTAAERSRRATPEGASVLMYGSPAGFWTWKESGVGPHLIRPRNKLALAGALGHPIRTSVVHPGFAGKQAWSAAVDEAVAELNDLLESVALRAAA